MGLPPDAGSRQDGLYEEAAATFGPALQRLARAYEPDADRRLDLLQEIHVALWRSFASFNGSCSLRTWVYRVAHNVAMSQVIRRRGKVHTLVGLDELEAMPVAADHEQMLDDRRALDRMMALIRQLDPLDRQVTLLYLEGSMPPRSETSPGFRRGTSPRKCTVSRRCWRSDFREVRHDQPAG